MNHRASSSSSFLDPISGFTVPMHAEKHRVPMKGLSSFFAASRLCGFALRGHKDEAETGKGERSIIVVRSGQLKVDLEPLPRYITLGAATLR